MTTPADRRLLAEIRERTDDYGPVRGERTADGVVVANGFDESAPSDRRELLRIVGDLEHLLRERADHADDAAEAEFLRPIGGGL